MVVRIPYSDLCEAYQCYRCQRTFLPDDLPADGSCPGCHHEDPQFQEVQGYDGPLTGGKLVATDEYPYYVYNDEEGEDEE